MAKGFAVTMREYFGMNGKQMSEFVAEIKALSYEEKMAFSEMLTKAGFPHDPPLPAEKK